jgi:dTDP-4-dehydrorhamnose reductase
MRIALLGSTGYVGSEFSFQMAARGHELLRVRRGDCDFFDVASLTERLRRLAPDALVNCAGYTGKPNVDACENDKARCLAGNAVLPGIVAQACAELDLPWGHVSSGCIYTGRRVAGNGFTEDDPPNFTFRQNNCSFYSGTKALGEEALAEAPKCYIWRLRIPFSHIDSPRNYLTKLMRYQRLLDAENSLSWLPEFVAAGLQSLEQKLPYGIYNLTNPGSVTTREVVQLILKSGVIDKAFDFFESEEEFMALAASTPRSNCVMDSGKALRAGLKLTETRQALQRALLLWRSRNRAEPRLQPIAV